MFVIYPRYLCYEKIHSFSVLAQLMCKSKYNIVVVVSLNEDVKAVRTKHESS